MARMNRPKRHALVAGAQITALGTLSSRVLGMVRDMATAALLGMAETAAAGMLGGRLFGAARAVMVAPSTAFTERARVYDETNHLAPAIPNRC